MPTALPGLRIRLTDFAYEELTQKELGESDRELLVSAEQLCNYLEAAENKAQHPRSLGKHSIAPMVKKRKRSETPPEEITSSDEARYTEQEEREAKRVADSDPDYEELS